jgi:hypothetical protein
MTVSVVVYVALLDDGTTVWRPVNADPLGGDLYRILDKTPDDEVWEFKSGDVVRCQRRQLSGDGRMLDNVLVAYERSN